MTDTYDFFTCLTRLTRPTRPTCLTCLTRPAHLIRITGSVIDNLYSRFRNVEPQVHRSLRQTENINREA